MKGLQIFLGSAEALHFLLFIQYLILVIISVPRKFFLASETAQRHVTEIVEKDVREIGGLIEATDAVGVGVKTLAQYYYPSDWAGLYEYMGQLSLSWSIFNEHVFLVSLTPVSMEFYLHVLSLQ